MIHADGKGFGLGISDFPGLKRYTPPSTWRTSLTAEQSIIDKKPGPCKLFTFSLKAGAVSTALSIKPIHKRIIKLEGVFF